MLTLPAEEQALNAWAEDVRSRLASYHEVLMVTGRSAIHGQEGTYKPLGRVSHCPGDYYSSPTRKAVTDPFHAHERTKRMRGHGKIADTWCDAMSVAKLLRGRPELSMLMLWLYPKEGLHTQNPNRRPYDWPPLTTRDPVWGHARDWLAAESKLGESHGRCAARLVREFMREVRKGMGK